MYERMILEHMITGTLLYLLFFERKNKSMKLQHYNIFEIMKYDYFLHIFAFEIFVILKIFFLVSYNMPF